LYDGADLVTTIKITRLRWAGHVMRMRDNLPCKKITLDKPEGRTRAGRPNLRWIDGVTKDAEKLGVRNWRARARDRDDWRRLIEMGVRDLRARARDRDHWRRLLESATTLYGL